jgi:hypothetical protein
MVIRAGGTAPPLMPAGADTRRGGGRPLLDLATAVRAYEVAVRGVARLPRRASDAAKLQFIEDMKRLRELRDRVVELRRGLAR